LSEIDVGEYDDRLIASMFGQ